MNYIRAATETSLLLIKIRIKREKKSFSLNYYKLKFYKLI